MWRAVLDEVGRLQAGYDRDATRWVEDYEGKGGRLWCAQGCCGCCSLAVETTLPEALAIAAAMPPEREQALQGHVERLREGLAGVEDLKSFLRVHRRQIGPCPFLDGQGACSVYQVRPLACRSLLATRNSSWCVVDFAELPPLERQLFMDGLDREVSAFPTHYVSATQELAREAEEAVAYAMHDRFGFTVNGNLPYLVWLEREHALSSAVAEGREAVENLLRRVGGEQAFVVRVGGG